MAKLKESELKMQIKGGNFSNLYYLYGDEKMLVRTYTERLRDKIIGKTPSDFNYHTYNGQINVNAITMDMGIVPFAQPVNYVEIIDPSIDLISDGDFKDLVKTLQNIPQTTVVVISMLTTYSSGKKPARWKKLADVCTSNGTATVFDKKTAQDIKKLLIGWANKRDIVLSSANAQLIFEYCGSDLQSLKNELEKLCSFVGTGEITAKEIDALVTKNLEARVFDMADAVVKGDYDSAFTKLDQLFYQREEPVNILAVLSSSYVDMYRMRIAIESGESQQMLTEIFDYKRKEFRLNKAQRSSKGLSTQAICKSLEILADTNAKMNSSSADKRILLEQLVGKLILAGKRA